VGGKWGFVGADGVVAMAPRFEGAKSFANGMAAATRDGLWGYVDESFEFGIEPEFADATYFSEKGSSLVLDGEVWRMLRLICVDNTGQR
jgi:hypothetical protein